MSPLLLLHGFTGAADSFALVVDQPAEPLLGHGAVSSAITFEGEVDRIAARIGQPVHVLGYSMGARLALGLMVRHPTKVARATLVGLNPGEANRSAADEAWATMLERDGLASFVDRWEAQPLFVSQRRLPPDVQAALRRRRMSHDPHGLARAMRTLGVGRMPDYGSALAGIRTPVRLLAGTNDPKFVALGRRCALALPRAELRLLDGAGHDLTLERPRDVAAALKEDAP